MGNDFSVKTSVNYLGCTLERNAVGVGMVRKVKARTKFFTRKSVFLERDRQKPVESSLNQNHFDITVVFPKYRR